MNNTVYAPWSKPFHIMAKAAGASCNMRCKYCYYLEKDKNFNPNSINKNNMSDDLLKLFVKQYISAQPLNQTVFFTWHGGEALLRPIKFYQKALYFQKKYAFGRKIENSIQTNGVLVNDEWCKFFRDNNFLVGISLDGTEKQHNHYRRMIKGEASFNKVMRAIRLMQKYGVAFNILSTINNYNGNSPIEYYQFLKNIGAKFIQFTPIVERCKKGQLDYTHLEVPVMNADKSQGLLSDYEDIEMATYSITPKQWGNFLCDLFDEWVRKDVGNIFVQMFDTALANWLGYPPGLCIFEETCGHAAIIEHNGDVYSCDHFVYPRYFLGNIKNKPLTLMMQSEKQGDFGLLKKEALTTQCKECIYLFACNGECPKNRFAYSNYGEKGHNYLCSAYYQFWEHISPYMDFMKDCIMKEKHL